MEKFDDRSVVFTFHSFATYAYVGSRPQGRDLHAPLEGNVGPLDTVTYVDRLRAHGFSYEVSWSFAQIVKNAMTRKPKIESA